MQALAYEEAACQSPLPQREQRANPAKAPPRTEASTCGAWHPDSRRDLLKWHGLLQTQEATAESGPVRAVPQKQQETPLTGPRTWAWAAAGLAGAQGQIPKASQQEATTLTGRLSPSPSLAWDRGPRRSPHPCGQAGQGDLQPPRLVLCTQETAQAPRDPSAQLQEAGLFWCDTPAGRGAGPRRHSAPDMESGTPMLQCRHSGPPGRTPPPVFPGWEQAVCTAWVSWGGPVGAKTRACGAAPPPHPGTAVGTSSQGSVQRPSG